MSILRFPKNFYWGSAVSAHQVEGDNVNSDWWAWEFVRPHSGQEGNIDNGEVSGKACDFWNRYREDPKLAKALGQNAFRFSIEWAKVIKSNNQLNNKTKLQIDKDALKHYQDVIDYCRELGLEPFVTLHHFTNPKWFSDLGGWKIKEAPELFTDYVKVVMKNIKDVKYWLTINGPLIYAANSFLRGIWPPQARNPGVYSQVIKNLIKAHKLSYDVIHKTNPKAKVGIARNNQYFDPENKLWDPLFTGYIAKRWNHDFLLKIKDKMDFIGLNYYFHNKLHFNFIPPFMHRKNKSKIISDIDWEIYPEGLYKILMDLKKYNLPICITENGLADAKDDKRSKFIISHLKNIHRAIGDGVDVKGYFYWSLIDNFEWNRGFSPRFGLIEIDYKTQKRTIRPSAKIYAQICKEGVISEKIGM